MFPPIASMSCQTHRLGCNHLQALHQLQRGDGAAAGAVHMLANVLGDQHALGFVRHFTGAKVLTGLADRHLAQLDAATAWALAVAQPQQHVGQLGAGILHALRQHPGHEAGVRVHQAAVLRQAAQDLHAALHLSPALGNAGANHVESAAALARQLLGHVLQLLLGQASGLTTEATTTLTNAGHQTRSPWFARARGFFHAAAGTPPLPPAGRSAASPLSRNGSQAWPAPARASDRSRDPPFAARAACSPFGRHTRSGPASNLHHT